MAIQYGTTVGVLQTNSSSYERVYVQGANGSVVTIIPKYIREEITTESMAVTAMLPPITPANLPTTYSGYELRLSNTDFAREFYTVVTWKTIPL